MSETQRCQSELAIVLPSLNPDYKFIKVVEDLIEKGFQNIVIVDDGSDEAHQGLFDEASRIPACHVLHHEVNRGKGRALKTAFRYVLDHQIETRGVITIDGDGQHLTQDIIACGERMLDNDDKVVLGCRDFDQPGVPARSVTGNKTTSRLFRICYGIKLSDTQTGLRAIPRSYLESFCEIEGERFEYETNMLLQMKRLGIGFLEQPITTVYDPEDYSSHYDAVKDSWRIFKIMFKYLLSSAASFLIDNLLFYLLKLVIGTALGNYSILAAAAVARAFSSFFNFNANKKVVFGSKGNYRRSMLRYYCVAIPILLISSTLVTTVTGLLSVSSAILTTLIKIVVDTVLFFVSYNIQREWVFASK